MIYDCFLYNGEKELLEIRLNEMCLCNDWVTYVIIEASKTHTGWGKRIYFEQHKEEFSKFNIMYMLVDDMPMNSEPRKREEYQRNQILTALKFLSPKDDDIIIISDVDEIPRAKQVSKFKTDMEFAALIMDKYNYYLNLLEGYQIWNRAKIMTWAYLKNKTPEKVRNSGYDFSINDAGFHFSWIGDAIRKLESFSHVELNTPENIEKVQRAENIWNNTEFKKVEIDLSFPEHLVKNIEKFKEFIL